tara:strand:+ start:1508 stop:2725 length:1218 start_codon:yes stop_codon:yes gene_type:complete
MYTINDINNDAASIFKSIGFPDKKNEFWKYTNLKKFQSINMTEPQEFDLSQDSFKNFDSLSIPVITILNGKVMSYPKNKSCLLISEKFKNCSKFFYNSFIPNDDSVVQNNPFLILNSAHFSDGIYMKMKSESNADNNVIIRIITDGKKDDYQTSYSRIHIETEENSKSKIILHHIGTNNKKYYKNMVLNVDANKSSKVSITNIFEESKQSFSMNNVILNQKSYSEVKQKSFYLKSGFIRTDISNNLNEPESYSSLNGLFLGNNDDFIDNNIMINHNSEHTYSKVLYKGIMDGKSNAVFNALVNVPFKSKQIDSDQKNHNIILSKTAKINSNPKLKISCDDVKCAHGSTIGNLDEEALFYLRSRGIGLKKSKQILLNSFMNELIDDLSINEIKNYIDNRIGDALKC